MRRWCRLWRRLRAERRATALIEFALLLPVMLTLYLGGFRLMDAAACNRRVTVTARSLADLVSQYATINETTLRTILDASAQMMTPYDVRTIKLRVTQIRIDGNSRAFVDWSRVTRETAYAKNLELTATLPLALRNPNTSIIYSEVTYSYPAFIWVGSPMTFSQQSVMMPRLSPSVTLTPS